MYPCKKNIVVTIKRWKITVTTCDGLDTNISKRDNFSAVRGRFSTYFKILAQSILVLTDGRTFVFVPFVARVALAFVSLLRTHEDTLGVSVARVDLGARNCKRVPNYGRLVPKHKKLLGFVKKCVGKNQSQLHRCSVAKSCLKIWGNIVNLSTPSTSNGMPRDEKI